MILITEEPYVRVDWYITHPNAASSVTIESDPGNGSTKEATMSFTFNSEFETGKYVITAQIVYGLNRAESLSYVLDVQDYHF